MCDYSLHLVAHRPAAVGDKLTTTRFVNSTTRGFMVAGDANTAVCVLPGTELAFDNDVEYRPQFLSFRNRKTTERVARFRNINEDNPNAYHDALEFPGGQIVLLNDLIEGQQATVLQLPATERPAERKAEAPTAPELTPSSL